MAQPGDQSTWWDTKVLEEAREGATASWTALAEHMATTLTMFRENLHKVQLQLQGDMEGLADWQRYLLAVGLVMFVPVAVFIGKKQAEYENSIRKMLEDNAEKRKRKKAKKKGKQSEVEESDDEEVEDEKEEELEDITTSLHTRLQERVSSRVEEVRERIEERRRRMEEKVREVEAAMEEELEVVRAKHKVEVEEVEERCRVEVAGLQEECKKELKEMKKAVRELKVVLSASEVEEDVMEQSRSELECPVSH